MHKSVWIPLLAILFFVMPFFGRLPVHGAMETFDISGVVVNNTNKSGPVDNSLVTLGIRRLNKAIEIQRTTTDADGTFKFAGVDYHEDALYEVSISFDNVTYKKNVILPTEDASNVNIILTVYSTTDSSDVVSIFNTSILFTDVDVRASRIYVMEMVTLQNETDFTYIPGDGPMELLRFGLPNGSEDLYVETDIPQSDWLQVDKGFALITPIFPGKHELLYTYNFPYQGSGHVLSRRWRYGAENIRILIPAETANIKSDMGSSAKQMIIGDIEYSVVEGVKIQRNQDATIELTNLPEHNLIQKIVYPPEKVNYYYAGPIALFLFLLVFMVFAIFRLIRSSSPRFRQTAICDEGEIVKNMIDKLDSDLENGRISKSEHGRKLYILKRRGSEISTK